MQIQQKVNNAYLHTDNPMFSEIFMSIFLNPFQYLPKKQKRTVLRNESKKRNLSYLFLAIFIYLDFTYEHSKAKEL